MVKNTEIVFKIKKYACIFYLTLVALATIGFTFGFNYFALSGFYSLFSIKLPMTILFGSAFNSESSVNIAIVLIIAYAVVYLISLFAMCFSKKFSVIIIILLSIDVLANLILFQSSFELYYIFIFIPDIVGVVLCSLYLGAKKPACDEE